MTDMPEFNDPSIHVARLVHSIQSDLSELCAMRVTPETAHLLAGEEQALGSAMTAIQLLLTHIQSGRPVLRVVR